MIAIDLLAVCFVVNYDLLSPFAISLGQFESKNVLISIIVLHLCMLNNWGLDNWLSIGENLLHVNEMVWDGN